MLKLPALLYEFSWSLIFLPFICLHPTYRSHNGRGRATRDVLRCLLVEKISKSAFFVQVHWFRAVLRGKQEGVIYERNEAFVLDFLSWFSLERWG